MLTLVTAALLAAVPILVYLFLIWNFNYWQKRGITTATVKPLLGSFPNLFSKQHSFADQVDDIYKRYSAHEKFVGIFLMRAPQLLILDPALIRGILVTHFKNFHDNDIGRMIDTKKDLLLAKNPFVLQGKEWEEQRALISPGICHSRLKVAYSLTQTICWKLCQYIEKQSQICGRDGINGQELALRFTSESIADCVLGIKLQSFRDQLPPIAQHFRYIIDDHSTFFLYSIITSLFPAITNLYKAKFSSKQSDKFFVDLMREAFDNRAANQVDYHDLMHHLITLKAQHNLNDTEMASYMISFLIDGLQTTGVVISHALLLLARYPKVQAKLRKEVLQNLDDENGELSFEILNSLPYLDACFNESLRIFPTFLWSSKVCTAPHEFINSTGQKVPIRVGEIVFLPIYSIHRDARYYPEPEEFKPERFLPENGGVKRYLDMGVFLGFSDGPRACLGKDFALVQSKAAIASIVKRFVIRVNPRTTDDLNLDPRAFVAMKNGGIWLDFERVY